MKNERGIALIAVLGVLAVTGLMVAHIALLSELLGRESVVAAERARLRYVAESAGGQAQWMHMVDMRLFNNRSLGQQEDAREDLGLEAWMLDGRGHGDDDGDCTVALIDADAGIDFSGRTPGSKLKDMVGNLGEDEEEREALNEFLDIAADYVDANDLLQPNGKEWEDYEAEGYFNFPRNGEMRFREEVYWLDNWEEFIRGGVRIIPPKDIKFPKNNGKPGFFSSTPAMIEQILHLDEGELQQILEARDLWRDEGVPLEDSLAVDLLTEVKSKFSFSESGVATFEIVANSKFGGLSRRLRLTLNCSASKISSFTDSKRNAWAVWERRIF